MFDQNQKKMLISNVGCKHFLYIDIIQWCNNLHLLNPNIWISKSDQLCRVCNYLFASSHLSYGHISTHPTSVTSLYRCSRVKLSFFLKDLKLLWKKSRANGLKFQNFSSVCLDTHTWNVCRAIFTMCAANMNFMYSLHVGVLKRLNYFFFVTILSIPEIFTPNAIECKRHICGFQYRSHAIHYGVHLWCFIFAFIVSK